MAARRSSRSSARWTRRAVDLEPVGELTQARLGRLAARRRHQPDEVRLLRQASVGIERLDRVELPAGRADRALEVRGLGVQDAVELAAKRPGDLPRLDLEQRPGCADPAQERADGLAALRRHHPAPTTDPPRDRQPEGGQAGRQLRRRPRLDHELEVRPAARQAERTTRQESTSEPGRPAVLGGGGPHEGDLAPPLPRSPKPMRQPGDRRLAAGRFRTEAVHLRRQVARPRRIDRGQLVAHRRHEVALGAAHLRRSGWQTGRRFAGGSRTRPRARRSPPSPGGLDRGGARCPCRRPRRG